MEADPESAGLIRRERFGWAIPIALLGLVPLIGGLFLPWTEVGRFVTYEGNREGPIGDAKEFPSIFDTVATVKDVTGPVPDAPEPGSLSAAFFPTGLIALTAVCAVVALVAAFGVRRAALTNTARIAGVILITATVAAALAAFFDLGFDPAGGTGPATASPGAATGSGGPDVIESEVQPHLGTYGWLLGMSILGVAAALGPRITWLMPSGGMPVRHGHQAGLPAGAPGPRLVRRTQVVAIVLMAFAAALGVAGYGFLPWGSAGSDWVTFAEVSDAAREHGFGDKHLAEAYFGFAGWLLLGLLLIEALVMALGRKPVLNPVGTRPILVLVSIAAGLLHVFALAEVSADYDIGSYTVGLAFVLAVIGALLPLRTSARVYLP